MGRNCSYVGCKNDYRKLKKSNPENIFFLPFPKPKTNNEKCLRWIAACCPHKDFNDFYNKISNNTFICSKHFEGGNGPTTENPEPIIAIVENQFQTFPNISSIHHVIAPVGWLLERTENDSCIFSKKRNNNIVLQCTVKPDLSYILNILELPAPRHVYRMLPKLDTLIDVAPFLDALNKVKICAGNTEEKLVQAFLRGTRRTKGTYCERTKTVYSVDCTRVSDKLRCSNCTIYRDTLRCAARRSFKQEPKNPAKISRQQLVAKVKLTQAKKRALFQDFCKLHKMMEANKNEAKGEGGEENEESSSDDDDGTDDDEPEYTVEYQIIVE